MMKEFLFRVLANHMSAPLGTKPVPKLQYVTRTLKNSTINSFYQPILLPNEYCLAEDDRALLDLYAERKGFSLFSGDFYLANVKARLFLTNYRVILFQMGKLLTQS